MASQFQPFELFQHTAARRRLAKRREADDSPDNFNTQPPEGGWHGRAFLLHELGDNFNTQPPEGGWCGTYRLFPVIKISTHSRPKAAGTASIISLLMQDISTHSRPKAAGAGEEAAHGVEGFQHTAARRRLGFPPHLFRHPPTISTHSRPKAAGSQTRPAKMDTCYFNTQPPEGGWSLPCKAMARLVLSFQHTAARRRLVPSNGINI